MSPLLPKTVRVLLVDPSQEDQVLVKGHLLGTPYTVEIAADGVVALDRVRLGGCDVVLMDLQMSAVDGLTATCKIRDWERQNGRAPIPIIALAADAQDTAKSIEAGCAAQLTKPFGKGALLQALNRCRKGPAEPVLSTPAVAAVPAALKSLVPRYLEGRHKDIETLHSALAQGDFEVIASVGHNLKGTGTAYGFPEITEIGGSLERAAKERDRAEASLHAGRLENYLECVAI